MYKGHQKAKPLEGASSAPLGSRTGSAKGELLASASMRVRSATAGAPGYQPASSIPSHQAAVAPSVVSEGLEVSSDATTSTAAAVAQSQQLLSETQQGQRLSDTASTAAAASGLHHLPLSVDQQRQALSATANTSAPLSPVQQPPGAYTGTTSGGTAVEAPVLQQQPPSEVWQGSKPGGAAAVASPSPACTSGSARADTE